MHKFLRACGLSMLDSEQKIYDFIKEELLREENFTSSVSLSGGGRFAEYRKVLGSGIGLCAGVAEYVNGERRLDYYYPYFASAKLSSAELCSVERYTEKETYAGLIDEYKIGLSLIFFISNPLQYRMLPEAGTQIDFKGAYLSAFCNEATIILPVMKTAEDLDRDDFSRREQDSLLEAAKNGDEDAIETLTACDIDMFQQIAKRIEQEDLYSVVEQSLMPCGIECDQYSIIGEITAIDETENYYSGEKLWLLDLICNEVEFRLAVRKKDLTGEPAIGRRFKGRIWMQGIVDFKNPVYI